MNQENAVIASKIVPFRAIAADADFVIVQPAQFGPPPSFVVQFGKYTPAVPTIPGTPEVPQKSGPNRSDYVPYQPAVPEVPAVPATFTPHRTETLVLTQEEWDNWDKSVHDAAYVLAIVAERFGQKLAAE